MPFDVIRGLRIDDPEAGSEHVAMVSFARADRLMCAAKDRKRVGRAPAQVNAIGPRRAPAAAGA